MLVIFLKSIRMVFLAVIGPWKETKEQPKVAIYQQWLPTILALSVHVIPLAAAITMVSLNLYTKFPTTRVSTTSLQYLAKALELLTQASISAATLENLRKEYTSNDGVPFGAITAGLQLNSLSYLWSLGFLGSLWSPTFSCRRKTTFALFILFATLLTATVGPSIATCLIPRPVNLSGEIFVNKSEKSIYPERIETTEPQNHCKFLNQTPSIAPSYDTYDETFCPSAGWEALSQLPENQKGGLDQRGEAFRTAFILDSKTLGSDLLRKMANKLDRELALDPSPSYALLFAAPPWYALKVQSILNLESLVNSLLLNKYPLKTSFQVFSPVGVTLCQKPSNPTREDGSLPANTTLFQFEDPLANGSFTVEFPETRSYAANDQAWKISWSHANDSNISIIALLSNWTEPDYRRHLVCPVIAGWANSTQTITQQNRWPEVSDVHWARDPVKISKNWASLLAPSFGDSNSSVIDQLGRIMSGTSYGSYDGGDSEYLEKFAAKLSGIVSGLVVNGMSGHGRGELPFTYGRENLDPSRYSISYQKYYDGAAAYSSQGLSVKLSLTVLVSYVAYTLAFIIISIGCNRTASSAWDSISELTALALLSKPPEKSLKNTRAGIETVELFKQQVHIRVVENDNLELVFKEEDPGRKTESIVKNKAY